MHWSLVAFLGLLTISLLTAAVLVKRQRYDGLGVDRELAGAQGLSKTVVLALPNLARSLTPEEAFKENQERPFSTTPDTPAQQFHLRADQSSRDRAVECMTQVIYYEAAAESVDGKRAVAQVVLNRMRHPGFPSSVCGVVYQGSKLPTGCQFTFTCDGSIARKPIVSLWAEARRLATQAITGHVFAGVGHATHYHADYVLPYWADSLAKKVQIGRHIFYRLRGELGSARAFTQRHAGQEPDLLSPPSTVALAIEATDQAEALLDRGPDFAVPPVGNDRALVLGDDAPKEAILADTLKGVLVADGVSAPARVTKQREADQCRAERGRQLVPSAPNNLRADVASAAC